ncbi:MAG: binding-protein-dependent transport system inner rane component [Chloroflexi bacterium]|nr:binding-protein-dependent transport system inner rane component [Chloroflexota bacterium]
MAPGDPVSAELGRMSQHGENIAGSAVIIDHFRQTFGLNDPVPTQYLKYIIAVGHLDLGYSLANFPSRVTDIIAEALPWTIGLLTTATLIAFVIGTLLGAVMVWRATPGITRVLLPPLMILAAIPYYLFAVILLYLFAFAVHLFPAGGATGFGTTIALTPQCIGDVLYHSALPVLAIILTSMGGWILGMRAMMVTIIGSDFLTLAEAKGLSERRIFVRHAIRNAILPQVTNLAISLGYVVSGAVLVDVMYSYPGIGWVLNGAIGNVDYPLIQGITLILVITVAFAILVLDLVYPIIDPRITYRKR